MVRLGSLVCRLAVKGSLRRSCWDTTSAPPVVPSLSRDRPGDTEWLSCRTPSGERRSSPTRRNGISPPCPGKGKGKTENYVELSPPRKTLASLTRDEKSEESRLEAASSSCRVPKSQSVALNLVTIMETLPVLPPPPSFKTVSFAPVLSAGCESSPGPGIPTEGLPTGPAQCKDRPDQR